MGTWSGKAILLAVVLASPAVGAAQDPAEKAASTETHRTPRHGEIAVDLLPKDGDLLRYRIRTRRYRIYLERNEGVGFDPLDIGKILEAAWIIKREFFGAAPDEKKKLVVEIYADGSRMRAAFRRDGIAGTSTGGGYYSPRSGKAYLCFQPAGVAWTRGLVLHEAAHQFESASGRRFRGAPWWGEGIAEYLGMYAWKDGVLRLGVGDSAYANDVPARAALAFYAPRSRDFEGLLNARESYGYDASWAMVHFLMTEKRREARLLFLKMWKGGSDFPAVWKKVFGATGLPPGWADEFMAFLEKMKDRPAGQFFVSWGGAAAAGSRRGAPPPLKGVDLDVAVQQLGAEAPASLNELRTSLAGIPEGRKRDAEVKRLCSRELPGVIREILTSGKRSDVARRVALGLLLLEMRVALGGGGKGSSTKRTVSISIGPVRSGKASGTVVFQAEPGDGIRISPFKGVVVGNRSAKSLKRTFLLPRDGKGPVTLTVKADLRWEGIPVSVSKRIKVGE